MCSMKSTILAGMFAAMAGGATGLVALDNLVLEGPPGMKPLVFDVLAACPNAAGVTFVGTGTGAAESSLRQGTQTVAPMLRFLAAANTCAFTPDATEAE